MVDLTTRAGKGSPLKNEEGDANWLALNKYKAEYYGPTPAVDWRTLGGYGTYAFSAATAQASTNAPGASSPGLQGGVLYRVPAADRDDPACELTYREVVTPFRRWRCSTADGTTWAAWVQLAGDAAWQGFAPIANPTFTGVAQAPDIAVSKAAGHPRSILLRTGAANRWGIEASSAAESGANAGSNLLIRRHNDAGAAVDTPFLLDRASGRLAVGPGATAVDANAALLVSGGLRVGSWFLPGGFTFATLPTPSGWLSGAITHCSDAAGGAADVQCTGSEWLSLKTGLPADLQPTGGSGSKLWRRNADGTMDAWGSETIDMGGSNWAGIGPNGGRLTVTGTITYGGPAFVAAPLGVASWIDGDVSTWCSYMAYYSLGTTGVGGGIELISPFSRGVRGPGSGIISYNVRGRWKL